MDDVLYFCHLFQSSSEELCSLVGQCFQLVYTDATMQFFDKKVSEGAKGGVSGTSSVTYSSGKYRIS